MRKLTILLLSVMLLTSCLTTKTDVGAYRETQGNVYVYSKSKQIWLFWGIVPIGRTKTATPTNGACQVVTKFTLFDIIISSLTGGIITTETIKVKAKK